MSKLDTLILEYFDSKSPEEFIERAKTLQAFAASVGFRSFISPSLVNVSRDYLPVKK